MQQEGEAGREINKGRKKENKRKEKNMEEHTLCHKVDALA